MHFNWIEKDLLAASPLPRSAEDLETLRQGGIRAIITLTEQPLTIRPDVRISQADFERLDVAPYHIPIDDFDAPVADQVDQMMDILRQLKAEGRPALIHCYAGQGRTGTMLHAYYLAQGWSLRDARERVSSRRAICDFNMLSAPQQAFLQNFAAQPRTLQV
ncbi:MAG TPA: dual specificity protein phosphatase family protein [Aggregatilineales bacterium]|nr:dual specificity protein phosphatase family protein [Anaerolineae bacterium]HUN09873.1 dual specificity protein phosphatase family protein [Aggregatilineales bacterium]